MKVGEQEPLSYIYRHWLYLSVPSALDDFIKSFNKREQ